VDNEPAGAGAALPGSAHRAKYRAYQTHIQIGMLTDNNGIVAT